MEKNEHISDPKKEALIYISILVLTATVIGIHYLHLGTLGIALIVSIVSFEAYLLAYYFMHLVHTRLIINIVLLLTILFFLGLVFWPAWDIGFSPRTPSEYTVN
jgi:caa(3)-type oxidase subunit IV